MQGFLLGKRSACALMCLLFVAGCGRKDVFKKIEHGDVSMVTVGTYHGHTVFLRNGGDHRTTIAALRKKVEDHKDILSIIVDEFFIVPPYVVFDYKFTLYDADRDFLILRYFARISNHPIYAGYQIQLVFKCSSGELREVYTAEVPLE